MARFLEDLGFASFEEREAIHDTGAQSNASWKGDNPIGPHAFALRSLMFWIRFPSKLLDSGMDWILHLDTDEYIQLVLGNILQGSCSLMFQDMLIWSYFLTM
ncbi:hypothetical protein JHK84_035555 [Glycine max]|nr:hypothetical protein JHK84_035555 [Glycine max]